MPPRRQQSANKGLSAFTVQDREDGSPLRPTNPVKRARYYRRLIKWLLKQDERVPELISFGYITHKHMTVVSTMEHATDINHLKAGDATAPAKLIYVRSSELQAAYALNPKHVALKL